MEIACQLSTNWQNTKEPIYFLLYANVLQHHFDQNFCFRIKSHSENDLGGQPFITYSFEGLQTPYLTIPDYLSKVDVCTKSEEISSNIPEIVYSQRDG